MGIRPATEADLQGVLHIYNDVIATTTAVYAEQPVTLENRLAWFRARREQQYPVLVAEDTSGITGFASFGDFRTSPCYRYTVEHTVHVRVDRRRCGVGRTLVEALIPLATAMGKHVLIAGIDASNRGSYELHRRMGFEEVAHFRQVGRKFDRWLDLIFMQLLLSASNPSPG